MFSLALIKVKKAAEISVVG